MQTLFIHWETILLLQKNLIMETHQKIINFWFIGTLLASILGCSTSNSDDEINNSTTSEAEVSKIKIQLNTSIATRATETSFEMLDRIGLYVANQNEGQAKELLQQGNHVDNMRFTYSDKWTPDEPIYWKDGTTKADFYCYYPYQTNPNIHSCSFSTLTNQTTEENYKASEFLWGKTSNVSPTEIAVDITTRHAFSCAQIKLLPGDGFSEESLKNAAIQLQINHVLPDAIINLSNGQATACGNPKSISPWFDGTYYKAIIVPQTIDKSDLIVIKINGKEYKLIQGHTFEANKRHKFIVPINKTSSGINVGIGKWEDDPIDHGGNAE